MFELYDETSWLVYADWLEDQGLDARHIRMPGETNTWHMEYRDTFGKAGGDGVEDVGSWGFEIGGMSDNMVGTGWSSTFSGVCYPHTLVWNNQ
jgi:hypothetical protein